MAMSYPWFTLPQTTHTDISVMSGSPPNIVADGHSAFLDSKSPRLAQFALPKPSTSGNFSGNFGRQARLVRLPYEYSYGSESEVTYQNNLDLIKELDDRFLNLAPELHFDFIYRPNDWLETAWQFRLSREFSLEESDPLVLPDGELEYPQQHEFSLLVDQAYITVTKFFDPIQLTVGRKNFEDQRHWLYDTSLDVVMLEWKSGHFRSALSYSRENLFDGDLLTGQETSKTNNLLAETRYRGIEDHVLSAFYLNQKEQDTEGASPWFLGFSIQGNPSAKISYWGEFALLRGKNEESRRFSAYAVDLGITYKKGGRFNPNITLGYAYGSGGSLDEGSMDKNFRQSGFQSNETKFAGVSEFKVYGEVLDPELSNIEIFTLGIGFFPANNMTLDFVYHQYRQNSAMSNLRDTQITAIPVSANGFTSQDIGRELDIVIGMRRAFGIRRLGFDLRLGWFYPGDAYRRDDRQNERGISVMSKIWW